jgi:predicted permease
METLPGVLAVTYTDFVPLTSPGTSPQDQLDIEGYVPAHNEQMLLHRATIPPGYFQFMGIPMLEGRDFTERDDSAAPVVIIVNETFAHRFFGEATPIGRKVRLAGSSATIVGEVKDSKYNTPMESASLYFYLPFRQWFFPGLNFSILLKTAGDPMEMLSDLRREALALNQDAFFHSIRFSDAIGYSLYAQKVAASLLAVVGGLCVLLAAVGLYSVLSYEISTRTQELGVRMALGASRVRILALVIRQSLMLTVPGLLAGFVLALVVFRLFSGMLVNVSPADPATLALAALFLSVVTLLASYFPANRATRIEPMVALHCQ